MAVAKELSPWSRGITVDTFSKLNKYFYLYSLYLCWRQFKTTNHLNGHISVTKL